MSCSNFYILINQFSFHPRISGIRTHPALAGVRPSITIILWYYSIRLFRHPGNPHETRLPEKRSLHFIEILLYFIEISLHFVEIWLYFIEIFDTCFFCHYKIWWVCINGWACIRTPGAVEKRSAALWITNQSRQSRNRLWTTKHLKEPCRQKYRTM